MQPGYFVIANDLLGVVVSLDGDMCTLRDEDGKTHRIKQSACHEITNPHALALLLYDKVCTNSMEQK